MKSLILKTPEIQTLLRDGVVEVRRPVKPQPVAGESLICLDGRWEVGTPRDSENAWRPVSCPFGSLGEERWVRETHYCDDYRFPDTISPATVMWRDRNGEHVAIPVEEQRAEMLENMWYRADGEPDFEDGEGPVRWRSAAQLPQWASRLTVTTAAVRVERNALTNHVWEWVATLTRKEGV